jgi:hypothetical protein
MAGPLIVTVLMAAPDQAWFDRLRIAHFPPERNHLAAHLTLFHAIPPMLASVLEAGMAAFEITCDGVGDLS